MDGEEVIKWLKIMKANLNTFPEISCGKKIEALAEAIRLLKNEQSENPTSSDDCISKQDVLSEIIRFSTEEGASVECQQLYCDVNNMPSVTPQEPKTMVEIDLYSVIKQKYIEREVLDKIRAEIEQDAFKDVNGSKYIFVNRVNQILDKYKGEVRKRNEF